MVLTFDDGVGPIVVVVGHIVRGSAAVTISDGLSAGDTYLMAVVGEYETLLRETVFR